MYGDEYANRPHAMESGANGSEEWQRGIPTHDGGSAVRDCADPYVDDIIIGSGTEDMSEDELIEAHKRDLR